MSLSLNCFVTCMHRIVPGQIQASMIVNQSVLVWFATGEGAMQERHTIFTQRKSMAEVVRRKKIAGSECWSF